MWLENNGNKEDEEEEAVEINEKDEEDELLLRDRSLTLRRSSQSSNQDSSIESSEGNWEYISPYVEMIPEQTLSSLSLASSSDAFSGVGAFMSSFLPKWRN